MAFANRFYFEGLWVVSCRCLPPTKPSFTFIIEFTLSNGVVVPLGNANFVHTSVVKNGVKKFETYENRTLEFVGAKFLNLPDVEAGQLVLLHNEGDFFFTPFRMPTNKASFGVTTCNRAKAEAWGLGPMLDFSYNSASAIVGDARMSYTPNEKNTQPGGLYMRIVLPTMKVCTLNEFEAANPDVTHKNVSAQSSKKCTPSVSPVASSPGSPVRAEFSAAVAGAFNTAALQVAKKPRKPKAKKADSMAPVAGFTPLDSAQFAMEFFTQLKPSFEPLKSIEVIRHETQSIIIKAGFLNDAFDTDPPTAAALTFVKLFGEAKSSIATSVATCGGNLVKIVFENQHATNECMASMSTLDGMTNFKTGIVMAASYSDSGNTSMCGQMPALSSDVRSVVEQQGLKDVIVLTTRDDSAALAVNTDRAANTMFAMHATVWPTTKEVFYGMQFGSKVFGIDMPDNVICIDDKYYLLSSTLDNFAASLHNYVLGTSGGRQPNCKWCFDSANQLQLKLISDVRAGDLLFVDIPADLFARCAKLVVLEKAEPASTTAAESSASSSSSSTSTSQVQQLSSAVQSLRDDLFQEDDAIEAAAAQLMRTIGKKATFDERFTITTTTNEDDDNNFDFGGAADQDQHHTPKRHYSGVTFCSSTSSSPVAIRKPSRATYQFPAGSLERFYADSQVHQ